MANEQQVRVRRAVMISGLMIGGSTETLTADTLLSFQKTIPEDLTNAEVDVAVTIANVVAIGIEADQACTVKTNSTSVPDDTLALVADHPLLWVTGDPSAARFFTANVTKFYVTTTEDTVLKFIAAVDSTPVLADV